MRSSGGSSPSDGLIKIKISEKKRVRPQAKQPDSVLIGQNKKLKTTCTDPALPVKRKKTSFKHMKS